MLEKVKILKNVFVIKMKDISKYYTFSVLTMCLLLLESCREKPEEAKKLSLGNVTAATATKSLQSSPTLCYPIDGSPPGRGLTPRGSLECNPEIPAFPGEEYYMT